MCQEDAPLVPTYGKNVRRKNDDICKNAKVEGCRCD